MTPGLPVPDPIRQETLRRNQDVGESRDLTEIWNGYVPVFVLFL